MTKDGDAYCPALNMWCEEAKEEVDQLEARIEEQDSQVSALSRIRRKQDVRIAELEAENKVLWSFVNAADEWHDINNPIKTNVRVLQTREALHPYEEKPFTYDPDAPLKLA